MNCMSVDASKNLLTQQKEVVLSIELVMPESFYACFYDDEWYFGVANYISAEISCELLELGLELCVLQQNGPAA